MPLDNLIAEVRNSYTLGLNDELPEALNFTPVKEKQRRNGTVIEGKYWLINPNTDDVMGDCKGVYTPTNFSVLYDAYREGLELSGLDLSEIEITIRAFRGMAAMRADVVLKKYDYERIVGEPTQMRMKLINSHDLSFKYDVTAELMRLWCSNGCASIAESMSFVQKHTTYASPEKIGDAVRTWPSMLEGQAKLLSHMQTVPVSRDRAIGFLSDNVAFRKTKLGVEPNKKELTKLMDIWDSYKLGDNAYRLYNVLTHVSSHVEGRNESTDLTQKQVREEQRIEGIVSGDQFKNLIRYDDFAIAA
ncbi:MAG TPA: DUF932 domain-containing protein [Candidatus Obscuribacterales bacterium]